LPALTQRIAQVAAIARYAARQIAMGLRGKAFPLAELRNRAWFQSRRKKLPTVTLEEVFPGSANLPIRLERALPRAIGNVTVDELAVVALICQWLKPSVLFEFGTYNGRTTLNLAANTPADAKIYTLDIPAPDEAQLAAEPEDSVYHLLEQTGSYFRGTAYSGKIEQLWCDSARFDETGLRGQADLVFVDGAHSYDYVRSDTSKALEMVRPGGVILWHDYCAWYPGVFGYLHELLPSYPLKYIEGTHLAVLRK
jgi:predicted O-methyltransferase YrrM